MKGIKIRNSRELFKLLGINKYLQTWKVTKSVTRYGRSYIIDYDFLADMYIANMKILSQMKTSIDMIETYFDNKEFIKILQTKLEGDEKW